MGRGSRDRASIAPAPSDPSPVTARAVALGLFLGIGLNLVMLYNDYYLGNTPLILNHLPLAGMAVLLALVALNLVLRRWPGAAFASGELLLVWCMVALAGGIGATGYARCIIGFMASPAYLATPSNDYQAYLVAHLPDWAVVSRTPTDPAIRWYFEGLPRGQAIPWRPWLAPVAAWIGFFVAGYAVMFAFTSLLYRQWADRERLTFPIVYVPLEVAREPRPGRAVNEFLRNRLVWLGAAVPILIYAWNGAKSYWPWIPLLPLNFSAWTIFPDRPWSELHFDEAHIYFPIIGLTFLLTTEMSFSLWFFYLLYRLSYVWVAWIGAGGQGYFGNLDVKIRVLQSAGGIVVLTAFLLWTARRALGGWARRVRRGVDDRAEDLLPPRLTAVLLAAGLAGLVGFVIAHGALWWAAALGIVLYVCVIVFLTRLVVEAGMLLVGVEAIAYECLRETFPVAWLMRGGNATIATFAQLRGGVMSDLRELPMPYLMNGLRMCAASGRHGRKVLGVFALTIAVALGAASYARIATAYKYGATIGDNAYNGGWQGELYENAVKIQKSPPEFQWLKLGSLRVLPVGLAHLLTGALATAAMLAMRARFLWWPFHPMGFLVCGSWPMSELWCSVFLGWVAKATIATFGGSVRYRQSLPFFLGLPLGTALIAIVWTVVSLLTGRPGIEMMPN